MPRIEATVQIADDRQLVLKLPDTIPPGEHRIVVTIDEPAPAEADDTRWEDNVLVFNGAVEGSFADLLQQSREERIQRFLPDEPRP